MVFGIRSENEFLVTAGNYNRDGSFTTVTTIDLSNGVNDSAIAALKNHIEKHGDFLEESSSLHHGEVANRWESLVGQVL